MGAIDNAAAVLAAESGEGGFWEDAYPVIPHPGELIVGIISFGQAAFIGIAERSGRPTLAVYDAEACIQILMERDDMTREEAIDAFSYDTLRAWLGEHTPLFLWRRNDA